MPPTTASARRSSPVSMTTPRTDQNQTAAPPDGTGPAGPASLDIEGLIRDHKVRIWRYLRYLGCDREVADDLTQETFVKVLEKPFEDRGEKAAASYLLTVARNLFISQIRKTRRITTLDDLELADAAWQEAHEASSGDGDDRLVMLKGCLEKLTGQARDAITLFYEQQLSGQDLADKLGLSEKYVRVLLYRIRQSLRECVERKLGAAS